MKKIQSVEFDDVEMVARTSSAGEVTLTIGKGKNAKDLSAQEVVELRDWLNELTRLAVPASAVVVGSAVGSVVSGNVSPAVAPPAIEVSANPLDGPAGYIPMESRGTIILPGGASKVVPFVSDGRSDASTVAHRLPLDVALKKAGMELVDKSAELGKNAIVVNAKPTPKGARGDGK